MRLGDLDALKKEFALLMWKEHNPYDAIKVCDIVNQTLDFIDNASTVDTDEIYKKGYHNGFFATHGEPERPQGE